MTRESLLALNAICGAEAPRAELQSRRTSSLSRAWARAGSRSIRKARAAQDWFNYGLALSHAFYHQDAMRAMKKSVEADPSCSLCAWGAAWTMGPTLNYGLIEPQRPAALAMAEKARSLAKPGDEKAKRLADAIVARYQKSRNEHRAGLRRRDEDDLGSLSGRYRAGSAGDAHAAHSGPWRRRPQSQAGAGDAGRRY